MGSSSPSGNTTTTTKTDPWDKQQPYLEAGFQNISNQFTRPSAVSQQEVASLQSQIAALQGQSDSWQPTYSNTGEGGSRQQDTNPYSTQIQTLQSRLNAAQNPTSRTITADALPDYYPGQTIATDSPETQAALAARTGRAVYGSPLTAAAQDELTKTLGGQYLNSNPYIDSTYNKAARGVTQNYNEVVNPSIDSAFTKAGRFGSGAYAAARNTSDRSLGTELGDLATNIYGQNYANERNNQIKGMLYAPDLANQDYYDIDQLSSVGDYKTNLAQQQIDADMTKYNYNANKPLNAIQQYMDLIQGNYGGTSTQSNPYYRNSAGSALGTVAQGAGALASIASLFGGSDINIKEDIKYKGKENGHNIYEFRYKGYPQKYIGVMAQEVQKTHPEAVFKMPFGLAVNYNAIGVQMRRI